MQDLGLTKFIRENSVNQADRQGLRKIKINLFMVWLAFTDRTLTSSPVEDPPTENPEDHTIAIVIGVVAGVVVLVVLISSTMYLYR